MTKRLDTLSSKGQQRRIPVALNRQAALKSVWTSGACAALTLAFLTGAPRGASAADPLHGYCAGTNQCVDNGTNSPTTNNPPKNFGFTASSGPLSGDLLVDLLVPKTATNSPGSLNFHITGTLAGIATLFSASAWSTGDLDGYLGISASPANPIGAYAAFGNTAYWVYQANLGSTTLQSPSNPNVSPLENVSTQLPLGTYIVGFLNTGTLSRPNWVATANSGAILEDAKAPGPMPGAGTASLAFLVLLGAITKARELLAGRAQRG